MMSFENFVEYVKSTVSRYLPPEFDKVAVRTTEVNKNNNLKLTGVIITVPNSNLSPTIYLNHWYHKYVHEDFELDECVRKVAESYLHSLFDEEKNFDISHVMNYENAHGKIIPRLVSSENNDAFLDEIPHRIMDGLAVVYYLPVSDLNEKGCNASIRINNGIMKEWGVTEDELYAASVANLMANVEAKFQSMREILLETYFNIGEEIDERWAAEYLPPEDAGMYVLTNREKFFGAAMLLNHNVMDEIVDRIGEFYILPSSVHETIFIKKDVAPPLEILVGMVNDVNMTEVDVEEKLSDRVFLYDAKTKEIYRADHEAEHRKNTAETSVGSEESARTTPPCHTCGEEGKVAHLVSEWHEADKMMTKRRSDENASFLQRGY